MRSVHDVKATMMGSGKVKFKAEINYDGVELGKAYLRSKHGRIFMANNCKTKNQRRQFSKFIVRHTVRLMDCLGNENDRLENKIIVSVLFIRKNFQSCDISISRHSSFLVRLFYLILLCSKHIIYYQCFDKYFLRKLP